VPPELPSRSLSSPNIFPAKFPLGTVVEAIDEGATRYEAPERLGVSVSSAVRWHQASRSEMCECGEIEICVEDSGTGIDDDNMPHLFEVFFTTKPHGLGMGLSICRSIIESHGGRLWAERSRPRRAVFFIRLPTDERFASIVKRSAG
jgi:signal transduction histidine kinase